MGVKMIVVIPSIAGSMLPKEPLNFRTEPLTLEELIKLTQNAVVINYNRHPTTNQLLQQLIPNIKQSENSEYHINKEDIIIMASLANRSPSPGQEVNVRSLDQLVIFRVFVS